MSTTKREPFTMPDITRMHEYLDDSTPEQLQAGIAHLIAQFSKLDPATLTGLVIGASIKDAPVQFLGMSGHIDALETVVLGIVRKLTEPR